MILGNYTKVRVKNNKTWICERLPKIVSDPNCRD
jgi:hypothetical protein